jgi:hypothetical protein
VRTITPIEDDRRFPLAQLITGVFLYTKGYALVRGAIGNEENDATDVESYMNIARREGLLLKFGDIPVAL